MIINPLPIIAILKINSEAHMSASARAVLLAGAFREFLGVISWADFQRIYHLYLQSIPTDIAKEAWGLTQISDAPVKH